MITRPRFAAPLFLLLTLLVTVGPLAASEPSTASRPSPDEAIRMLQEGNTRFIEQKLVHPHEQLQRVKETAENGQHPFVTILSCSDSRVPLETIFDQGIGDIFSIRVAGNVCGETQAGSIEYGVEHTGTSLFLLLGHTHCGAVTAACTAGGHEGNVERLMERIEPAVQRTEKATGKHGQEIVEDCARENVLLQIESLFSQSATMREAARSGKVRVVGAIYDIATGKVAFLGEHPKNDELIKEPTAKTAPRVRRIPSTSRLHR